MITITTTGATLSVAIEIPGRLRTGPETNLVAQVHLGGSPVAVAALADILRRQLGEVVSNIRKEAYRKGASDRAKRCTYFADDLECGMHDGGCG